MEVTMKNADFGMLHHVSLVTLTMEAIRSSETLVLARAKWHNIPENGILDSSMF
jgi:hypothetical protein